MNNADFKNREAHGELTESEQIRVAYKKLAAAPCPHCGGKVNVHTFGLSAKTKCRDCKKTILQQQPAKNLIAAAATGGKTN